MRNRQTDRIPLPIAHRPLPDSSDETGGTTLCLWRKIAIATAGFLLFGFVIGLNFRVLAQEQPSEYQVKAAFIYNFAKFIDWPPKAFANTNSPIVLGILGKNVFGNDLEKTIQDRKVNNRPFQFKNFTSVAEITNCHILFISPSEKDDYGKIVQTLRNSSVLTVSESDGFIKAGGMINFIIEDTKIRFQISNDAAKRAGLKISSKLLSLAAPAS